MTRCHFPPLLALDPGTIEAILALIGIVFWVLNKLLGQQRRRRLAGRRSANRSSAAAPIARPPQQGQGDPLQSEIEEFLRRASGGRKPAANRLAPKRPPDQTANRQQRGRQPSAGPIPAAGDLGSPRAPQMPPQPVAVVADPSQDTPEAIDRHVKQF